MAQSLNAYVRATHNAELLEKRRQSELSSQQNNISSVLPQLIPNTKNNNNNNVPSSAAAGSPSASYGKNGIINNNSNGTKTQYQHQNASWLSRILNNDDFQSSPMSLELPVRRSFTPLRPSANAMSQRVNASLMMMTSAGGGNANNNKQQDSSVLYSPLKQLKQPQDATNKVSPSTSQRSAARHGARNDGDDDLNGSRTSVNGGGGQHFQHQQNRQNLASPLRELSRVAAAAPVVHEAPPQANDPFMQHETAVMGEIRLLRKNPAEYAKIVESELLLTRPFLPAAHKRLNLAGMKAFVEDRSQQQANYTEQLAQLDEKHKAEVQALKDQWFADDNDRSKKRKNPAAQPGMKKADAEKALHQMLTEQEDQRRETIEGMDRATENLRQDLERKMGVVNIELAEARDGVDWLTKLISRLLTTRPLIPAQSNRGLSISARTVADESAHRNYANLSASLVDAEKELPQVCSRFGEPSGGYLGIAALIGPARAPRETVFEMLLSLADRKFRRSRHALLDPRSAMLGCAWRKKVGDPAVGCNTVTVVLTASHFSELSVINDRTHLNVDVLRREVPAACSTMHAGSYDAYTQQAPSMQECPVADHLATKVLHVTRETPEDPQGAMLANQIEIVYPIAQPAPCGNEAVILLRCGPNATVCAVVMTEETVANDSPSRSLASTTANNNIKNNNSSRSNNNSNLNRTLNKSVGSKVPETMTSVPQFAPGEQLVQRDPETGLVNVRVKLPSAGIHNVAVFLRDGSDVFRRVAVVGFDSTKAFDPRDAWRRYPVLSSDFADRNGYLVEPLDGVLAPDSEVVFKVSLPISSHYKGREKQRIAHLIAEAKQQDEHSSNAIGKVHAKLEEAKSKYEESLTSRDATIIAIQTEIAAYQKDLQKRKSGKEHDRLKALVAEGEAKIASIHSTIGKRQVACGSFDDELQGYHRTRQQTAAMLVRYAEEQKILEQCTDRSKPLLVELATDERRATLAPAQDGSEVYSARIRTPGVGGHVSLFVGGALAILFDVFPPPPHYLTSNAAQPMRLEY